MESIGSLFEEQRKLVDLCFSSIDLVKSALLADRILETSRAGGLLHFSGMGKSGIISKYLSQMFASIGMPASFLSPTDAFHGDLGMIRNGDMVILISRSGQTVELLNLLPMVSNRQIETWAIVCNSSSQLATKCSHFINLPLDHELCPFDAAPVTSSVLQVFFGSVILAYIMRRCGLDRQTYAQNHPGGRIGKRLILRVKDVMKDVRKLAVCHPTELLITQIGPMSRAGSGCLLVIEGNSKLIGIFTDGDLRRALEKYGKEVLDQPLSNVMTKFPKVTHQSVMAYQVMCHMETAGDKRIKEMPVVDLETGQLEGLVTLHDLVNLGL